MKTPPEIVPAGLPWLDNSGQYIAPSGRFRRVLICVMAPQKQLPGPIRQDFIHRTGKALSLVATKAAQAGARCSGGGGMGLSETSGHGGTARRVVKSRVRRSHLRSKQHNLRAVLSVVRKGRTWRVQIARPNGCVRYFGRFRSATRARAWITAHACRINPVS
jgi:hypothetical protein